MTSSLPEYFSLFGLEPRFSLDAGRLAGAYREVLSRVHPDRFASAGPAERRAAMQLASHANEAYEVLRGEATRAAYLCACRGIVLEGPQAPALDPGFLEQQMHWRERLEDAGSAGAVDAIGAELAAERAQLLARLGPLLDADGAATAMIAGAVRSLQFLDKLGSEIRRRSAALAEAPAAASGAGH